MKSFAKGLQWAVIFCLVVVIGVVVYFGVAESYIYFTRSEVKAQTAAQGVFLKVCERENLDPHSFQGPYRPSLEQDKKRSQYTFVWSRKRNESIYVNVSYLPYDFAYSTSEALIEHPSSSKPKS